MTPASLHLLVLVLARRHGASSALVGVMLGIAAGGGLLGALLAPALRRRLAARSALMGETWVMALVLPLLLVAHNALLLGLIVAAAELVTPVTNSIVTSHRVALTPDRHDRHPDRLGVDTRRRDDRLPRVPPSPNS